VTVVGSLAAHAAVGWAECQRGHRIRVHRIGAGMPAGALR
jgi:hypothetical protein